MVEHHRQQFATHSNFPFDPQATSLLKSDHCFLLRMKNYNSSQYITEFLFSENNFTTLQLYSSFKSLKFNLRTHAQNIFPFAEAHKTNCLCTSL